MTRELGRSVSKLEVVDVENCLEKKTPRRFKVVETMVERHEEAIQVLNATNSPETLLESVQTEVTLLKLRRLESITKAILSRGDKLPKSLTDSLEEAQGQYVGQLFEVSRN